MPSNPLSNCNKLNNLVQSIPKNYRTVPCRQYHGSEGCTRGEHCHFIHEGAYAGVDLPKEVMMRIRDENKAKYAQSQLAAM